MGRPCAFLMCIASIFDGPRGFMIRWHQLTNGGFTSLEKVTQPRFLSLKCAILRASGGGGDGGGGCNKPCLFFSISHICLDVNQIWGNKLSYKHQHQPMRLEWQN